LKEASEECIISHVRAIEIFLLSAHPADAGKIKTTLY
jgi:hypothetical protein